MDANRKKIFFALGGIATALVLAAVAFVLTFNINSYKSDVENIVSGVTGLDVRINGNMGFSFFPFGISVKDTYAANKRGKIISLEELNIRVAVMPLLKKQLKVTRCELVKPAVTIVKEADGKYNFEVTEKKPTEWRLAAVFNLTEFKLDKGALVYSDKTTGNKTEFKDLNLNSKDLSVVNTSGVIIKDISFTGNLNCKEVRNKGLKIENVKSSIKTEKGVIYLTSLTMDIFGAKAEGDVMADKSEVDAAYKINLKLSQLDFEKIEESFGTKKIIGGKGILDASLTLKEKGSRALMSSMNGVFSLRGDNLVTYTMDLDKALSSFETSRKFNLVDLGTFFIAGPLGVVALKGYRYGDLYHQTRGGRGVITKFSSYWKIKDGVAEAEDCALATRHNRVALKGRLNLVSKRYENVTVALLDDKGCAKFKQDISGHFGSPQVSPVNTIESLTGPIFNLYRKVKRFVQGGKCEVFYNGAVQQPPK